MKANVVLRNNSVYIYFNGFSVFFSKHSSGKEAGVTRTLKNKKIMAIVNKENHGCQPVENPCYFATTTITTDCGNPFLNFF